MTSHKHLETSRNCLGKAKSVFVMNVQTIGALTLAGTLEPGTFTGTFPPLEPRSKFSPSVGVFTLEKCLCLAVFSFINSPNVGQLYSPDCLYPDGFCALIEAETRG